MKNISVLFLLLLSVTSLFAQQHDSFDVIPLGVKGGSDESNLSCYAVAATGTGQFICFDAGTLYSGIRKAIENGSWKGTQEDFLKNAIKGYMISHPHLDHVAGLILNAPDDTSKPIYGLPYTLDVMTEKYFSWKSWANWSDKGETPMLKKFHLTSLTPGVEVPVPGTPFFVRAFLLSHTASSQSTAFLVRSDADYVLYLGDTGSDAIEKSTLINDLWNEITPIIKQKKLHGIFIETSFSNSQPDNLLFGHFTPKLLMQEFATLEGKASVGALKGLPIVITHMKPSGDREATIKKELATANALNLKLIFPEQGVKFGL